MSAPSISILLPTWNGADTLCDLLPQIASQEYPGPVEVHAFDSGSTDGTLDLLKEHGVDVQTIDKSEFSHGGTRNRIAARARGEYLVFMSQDVVPRDNRFLAELVKPLGDPRVAGSMARVLPFPGSDPLTARTVLDLPEASELAVVRDLDELGPVWDLDPITRVENLRFNNVASVIRANVFERYPFPLVDFGEDFAWASRVLTAGLRLAFAPDSVVFHSHQYSPSGAFQRYRTDAAFHRAAHGWNMRPNLLSVLRGIAFELREDLAFVSKNGWSGAAHLLRAPALRGAQVWGQYLGGREVRVLNPSPSDSLG